MPFALVVIGLILVITGAKGTQSALAAELKTDFTGPGNFTWWIAAIGAIGALGYIEQLRSFSRWFMALILVAMILSNRGFFAQFEAALKAGPIAPPLPQSQPSNNSAQYPAAPKFVDGTDPLHPVKNAIALTDRVTGGQGPNVSKAWTNAKTLFGAVTSLFGF